MFVKLFLLLVAIAFCAADEMFDPKNPAPLSEKDKTLSKRFPAAASRSRLFTTSAFFFFRRTSSLTHLNALEPQFP